MDSIEEKLKARVQTRVDRGDFLAQMLHLANGDSKDIQTAYLSKLTVFTSNIRNIFNSTGIIAKLNYAPSSFWPKQKGSCLGYIDGGVANVEIPSASPLGIRVGSYIVRPGLETAQREEFSVEYSLVDDMFDYNSQVFDDVFDDTAKMVDAARMTAETAAALQICKKVTDISAIFVHGPLINPVSPYGLADFPAYTNTSTASFTNSKQTDFNNRERHFVSVYLNILKQLMDSNTPVFGIVERSKGKHALLIRETLNYLADNGQLSLNDCNKLIDELKQLSANDAVLLGLILEPGEYVVPIEMNRQGPRHKWPANWQLEIERYPRPHTTFLKMSEESDPFRIEMFNNIENIEHWLSLIYHTAKLLPNYGFPVGLDIVDKYAKVPAWMSNSVKGQYAASLLRKALESGNPSSIEFAKRVVSAKGRDWLFRPSV